MGIRLLREVLDHAPTELAPAERFTLAVLAFHAAHRTRLSSPGIAVLTRQSRLSERDLRRILTKLSQHGLIETVDPAAPGRHAVYRLCTGPRDGAPSGGEHVR